MDCTHVQFATWYSRHHKSMLVMWRQQVSNLQHWIVFSSVLVVNCLHMVSILLWRPEYHVSSWTCVRSMFLAW
jgi:hypothetical protein